MNLDRCQNWDLVWTSDLHETNVTVSYINTGCAPHSKSRVHIHKDCILNKEGHCYLFLRALADMLPCLHCGTRLSKQTQEQSCCEICVCLVAWMHVQICFCSSYSAMNSWRARTEHAHWLLTMELYGVYFFAKHFALRRRTRILESLDGKCMIRQANGERKKWWAHTYSYLCGRCS